MSINAFFFVKVRVWSKGPNRLVNDSMDWLMGLRANNSNNNNNVNNNKRNIIKINK